MREQEHNYQNGPAGDDEQISHLLSSLPRVEAPGDFGFKVKARIAGKRQTAGRRSWLPASAAVAAPLGLALAVGGYFGLTQMYAPGTVQSPQVAELKPAALPVQDVSSVAPASNFTAEPVPPTTIPPKDIDDGAMAAKPSEMDPGIMVRRVKTTGSLRRTNVNSGGGTLEQAQPIGQEISPKAVDANRAVVDAPAMTGNPPRSAKSVLSGIGVDASFSGSSWTVGSVRQNTAADRSGLKAGDVIEDVNGRPLTGSSTFDSKFNGRTFRVRRDGKTVQIVIKN